jgi:hypothetical protein
MKIKMSEGLGPWQTRTLFRDGVVVGKVRTHQRGGYQLIMNEQLFTTMSGLSTNTKHARSLPRACTIADEALEAKETI